MSRNDNDTDDIILNFLCFYQKYIEIDKSIRWVGITDQNGIIINERDREG